MKPLGPIGPESPPPPKPEFGKVCLALGMVVLGVAATLYAFHDSRTISSEAFLAIMVFVMAVCIGVIMAMNMERRAHRKTHRRWMEVPPPSDFIAMRPPKEGGRTDDPPGTKRKSTSSRPKEP